jgi:pimeloyl-ACP methyl ester carboxylesterase
LNNAGYRVISFDAPAHGQSSGKQTSLYEISETILALQEIYGAFDSVITHSFGGPCTAHALRLGLETNRIVSICPPATTIGLIDKFCDALMLNKKNQAEPDRPDNGYFWRSRVARTLHEKRDERHRYPRAGDPR